MAFGDGAAQPTQPLPDAAPAAAPAPMDELLDDTLESLAQARAHMMRGKPAAKLAAVTRCRHSLAALRHCPDAAAGLEHGRLDVLCAAIAARLEQADAHNNAGLIDEISSELQAIRDSLD